MIQDCFFILHSENTFYERNEFLRKKLFSLARGQYIIDGRKSRINLRKICQRISEKEIYVLN